MPILKFGILPHAVSWFLFHHSSAKSSDWRKTRKRQAVLSHFSSGKDWNSVSSFGCEDWNTHATLWEEYFDPLGLALELKYFSGCLLQMFHSVLIWINSANVVQFTHSPGWLQWICEVKADLCTEEFSFCQTGFWKPCKNTLMRDVPWKRWKWDQSSYIHSQVSFQMNWSYTAIQNPIKSRHDWKHMLCL